MKCRWAAQFCVLLAIHLREHRTTHACPCRIQGQLLEIDTRTRAIEARLVEPTNAVEQSQQPSESLYPMCGSVGPARNLLRPPKRNNCTLPARSQGIRPGIQSVGQACAEGKGQVETESTQHPEPDQDVEGGRQSTSGKVHPKLISLAFVRAESRQSRQKQQQLIHSCL